MFPTYSPHPERYWSRGQLTLNQLATSSDPPRLVESYRDSQMRKTAGRKWSRLRWLWQEPHPIVTVIAWIFAIVLVFGLVIAATHPQPPSFSLRANQDPSLSRAAMGAIRLQKTAGNPESFVLEEVLGMRDGAFCYSYRAQWKLFGNINREQAVLRRKAQNPDQSDAAWRRYCVNRTGADLTDDVNAMMRGRQ